MQRRTTPTERKDLLLWRTANGKSGRCSSRCYSDTGRYVHDKCGCICGGMNHGKGKLEAIRNTRAFAHIWIASKKGVVWWDVARSVKRTSGAYGSEHSSE